MKASRILAGLSAVSLAASMLSMVAASADNPFTVDEGAATGFTGFENDPEPEEDGVETVTGSEETTNAADYDFGATWGKYPWYTAVPTVAKTPSFPGWPGWGFKTFPAGWEWIEYYKALQNTTWEEFGKKDIDTAAAGYLVFEFEGGKKQVVPVDVDANGQYVTDEFLIPFMSVQKVYFLYEVSEAPYFSLTLDAFNVNGKDVELNKDNAGNGVAPRVKAEGSDAIEGVWEEIPEFYQNTIFDKGNTNLVINHGLILWGTKVKVTFTVDGIGKYPVHGNDELNTGKGDNKGDIHTHVQPDETKGPYGSNQRKNLDTKAINPMFGSTDTRSRDLYDELVEVYNSSDDHSADAEIRFKTIADKSGVLVANFINVWERDEDADGNVAHWYKKFTDEGYAIYGKKDDNSTKVSVQGDKDEYSPITYYKATPVTNLDGSIRYEVDPSESNPDGVPYFKMNPENDNQYLLEKVVVALKDDIKEWVVPTNLTSDGSHITERLDKDGNVIGYVSTTKPSRETIKANKKKVPDNPQEKVVWVFDSHMEMYVPVSDAYILTADEKAVKANESDASKFETGIYAGRTVYVFDQTTGKYVVATDEERLDSTVAKFIYFSDVYGLPISSSGSVVLPKFNDALHYAPDAPFVSDTDMEDAYCWHPYFITENGLVDVVTKNYMGQNKTNYNSYTALSDSQIKYLSDNNGMYYNDNIHDGAYGHFVVFGDNTLREYSYRIKADAVKAMLDAVQRSAVQRDSFIQRHGSKDIYKWNAGSDSVQFGPANKLVIVGDHAYADEQDWESRNYLDVQAAKDPSAGDLVGYQHRRAVHGAIWLQCCEGTILRDVRVHAHTDIITQDTIPTLYGKENFDAMFPKKPAESKADAANGGAAQPTADAGAADNNAESGAAAGFGIAGLLLAGAAMVCVKKKN